MGTKTIALAASLFLVLGPTGCCTVGVPESTHSTEREAAGKIAAELNDPAIQAELSGNYKSKVNTTFATLNDKNVALYLWLKAAECESERGNKDLAREIYAYAVDLYKSQSEAPLFSGDFGDQRDLGFLRDQWADTLDKL